MRLENNQNYNRYISRFKFLFPIIKDYDFTMEKLSNNNEIRRLIIPTHNLSINRIVNSIQQIKFVDPAVNVLLDEIKKFSLAKKEEIISDENISFKKEILVDIKQYYYKKSTNFNLKDISFSINKGDKIGIIGPSGAGKSTLVEVLLGVLKPTIGDVKIDDKSIYIYQKSWKKKIGYVPQHIFIMDDTFRNNILFGLDIEKYSDNILIEVIKQIKLDKLLERLPNGLDHKLGERGLNLSGGEIQRIGISRALIYNPPIIFFDEATSSLDTFTERKILSEINNIKNITSITVAHITKDAYTPFGNITGRFFEAIKSNVPALVPIEFDHAIPVGLADKSLLVESTQDVIEKVMWLSTLNAAQRKALVDAQEEALRTVIDPRPEYRADLLEHILGDYRV